MATRTAAASMEYCFASIGEHQINDGNDTKHQQASVVLVVELSALLHRGSERMIGSNQRG